MTTTTAPKAAPKATLSKATGLLFQIAARSHTLRQGVERSRLLKAGETGEQVEVFAL